MADEPAERITTYDPIETVKREERYRDNLRKQWEARGVTEDVFLNEAVDLIENTFTGPLYEWQRFYIAAAISGRGVEWTQTRRGSHFHILGLPCSICGRG
jgi:pimeloyl-CoA synthetase